MGARFGMGWQAGLVAVLLGAAPVGCGDDTTVDLPADTGVSDTRPQPDGSDQPQPDVGLPDVPPAVDTTPDPDGSGTDEPDGSEEPEPPGPPPVVQTIVVDGASAWPVEFANGVPTTGGPAIVYPEDGTAMPRNVRAPVFQWEGASGLGYRLRLTGETEAVEVFTTDWKWEPSENEWRGLVLRFQGQDIAMSVSTVAAGQVQEGAPSRLYVSTANVDGAMYFWAPSQSAIVRLPVDADVPEPFVTGSAFSCAGCHALSPDGSRLAYTRGTASPLGSMGVVATDRTRRQIRSESISGYYPSFAGDNVRLAVARDGDIVVVDTDTGRDVSTIPRMDGRTATHPAWSPRRNEIVYAAGVGTPGSDPLGALGVVASGLAIARQSGTTWTTPQWLVEPGELSLSNETQFYPAFSPDGGWVVFNRADGGAGAGSSPPGAELWLVNGSPELDAAAIFLERANGPEWTTNSWPKWAPTISDQRMWIAFTSTRPYGRISSEHSQIWIASISIQDAMRGVDPSSAAYWMPRQELATSNHVAYWAPYTKDDETSDGE